MTFRKGQELVCIVDPSVWISENGPCDRSPPQKDGIYHFGGYDEPFNSGQTAICLLEYGEGYSFAAQAFRPLVKTSISIFTEILERESIHSTEKEKV